MLKLIDQPIAGPYLVEAEGSINLGPTYGRVQVAGVGVANVLGLLSLGGAHVVADLRATRPPVRVLSAQDQAVERLHAGSGKEGVRQTLRSIASAKLETKGVLRIPGGAYRG